MKEWQRWERMAADFESVGDTARAAESLSMAIELLPPGHRSEKAQMLSRIEHARTVTVEHGSSGAKAPRSPPTALEQRLRPEPGQEPGHEQEPVALLEGLGEEHVREAVMEVARALCRDLDGAREVDVVSAAARELDAEDDVVVEALDELVDEGLLYRPRRGRVMIDGIIEESDVEEAVLAAIAELSTGGRGARRADVIKSAISGGLGRGAVEEALVDLEDSGRIEEDRHGQLRTAMGTEQIAQVHGQILATLRDAEGGGQGLTRSTIVHALSERGWEIQEVEEAIEELEDSSDLVAEGAMLRLGGLEGAREDMEERVLSIVADLAHEGEGSVRPSDVIRRAGAMGLAPRAVHEAIDSLVDDGALSHDRRGRLRIETVGHPSSAGGGAEPRALVLELVRGLQRGHQGASHAEVVDQAQRRGLSEDEAEEALETLLVEGHVHEHGHGFLRPG